MCNFFSKYDFFAFYADTPSNAPNKKGVENGSSMINFSLVFTGCYGTTKASSHKS